jgi:hypothetical protein
MLSEYRYQISKQSAVLMKGFRGTQNLVSFALMMMLWAKKSRNRNCIVGRIKILLNVPTAS